MTKVLVLGGGDSPEREVSLRSAKAVAEAARRAGFEVFEADPVAGYQILDEYKKDTIVLPILHGVNGEDGVLQKELEKRELAFLGSDSLASANCFDKWQTRQMLATKGIPLPEGYLVTKNDYAQSPLAKKPHVLKVRRGGSSIGTLIVRNVQTDTAEVDKVFALDQEAIIEQLIEGVEATVPVLDKNSLPVIEIIPPTGLEFDYENKYNGATQEIVPPQNINQAVQNECQRLAESVHQIMNCRHLSRTDIMIGNNNKLYVLEINTMPGLTDQSLYPKSAAVAGYSMPDLVKKFVEMAAQGSNL